MLGVERKLKQKYVKTGLVRMVFHPVLNHGNASFQAHQGAECAADQGKFWSFREYVFSNQHRLYKRDPILIMKQLAMEAELDVEQFTRCLDEQRYAKKISEQDDLRKQKGIRAQPLFDINGRQIVGMSMFQTLDQVIQGKLTELE